MNASESPERPRLSELRDDGRSCSLIETQPVEPARGETWSREARIGHQSAPRPDPMRGLRKKLSEGEAVGVISRFYVDAHDPTRVKPGKRRLPDTKTVDGRTIPADVKREVWARTRGKCAVEHCNGRAFTQYAHLHPYSQGGDQEASSLVMLCPMHHALFDKGLMVIEGTAEDPIFKDRKGNIITGPGPPEDA